MIQYNCKFIVSNPIWLTKYYDLIDLVEWYFVVFGMVNYESAVGFRKLNRFTLFDGYLFFGGY